MQQFKELLLLQILSVDYLKRQSALDGCPIRERVAHSRYRNPLKREMERFASRPWDWMAASARAEQHLRAVRASSGIVCHTIPWATRRWSFEYG